MKLNVLIILVLLSLTAGCSNDSITTGSGTQKNIDNIEKGVNYQNFLLLETGDSLEYVNELFGQDGILSSDTLNLKIYQWNNTDVSNFYSVTVGFYDGKLQSKVQIGLRE